VVRVSLLEVKFFAPPVFRVDEGFTSLLLKGLSSIGRSLSFVSNSSRVAEVLVAWKDYNLVPCISVFTPMLVVENQYMRMGVSA